MSDLKMTPSSLNGVLRTPPSKSHTMRALLFALLGNGKSTIKGHLDSPDTDHMIRAIEAFGAKVQRTPDMLTIKGVGPNLSPAEDVIDAGNSGQILRFIGAIAALSESYTVITGDPSIRQRRPVKPLLEALSGLGAFAESTRGDGYAPVIIKGPMQGGKTTLCGTDSQPVSALLIAASFAEGSTEINVTNPGETPWIDLTLHWLKFLGLPYTNQNYSRYTIPGGASYSGFDYEVPVDFSTLSYPLVAALLTQSELTLTHVDMNEIQGDKKLISILSNMGGNIEIDKQSYTLKVSGRSELEGCTIDVNACIDALPLLAVVGCFAKGTTHLMNGKIARAKECDRIHAIARELKKMGADITEKEDGLVIKQSSLKGALLETYRDHRMALALSVASLAAKGSSVIKAAECVSKTYPNFKEHFIKMGAHIS